MIDLIIYCAGLVGLIVFCSWIGDLIYNLNMAEVDNWRTKVTVNDIEELEKIFRKG